MAGRMIRTAIACICAFSAACSNLVVMPSANYNSRVDYLVIHATSEDFAESLRLLTQPTANPVSSHYLVPAPFDPTYPGSKLKVYQLVPELDRAWHAGVSFWAGESALNDRSIGIEVVNEFKCTGTNNPIEETAPDDFECEFPSYDDDQIALLIELILEILDRFPSIDPIDVVGHSDIAILRKSDPGPAFPWRQLYEAGIGAWYESDTKAKYEQRFSSEPPPLQTVQSALNRLGYKVELSGIYDRATQYAMRAMQLHFRPDDFSGTVDVESMAIIWALLEKYRPVELDDLQASSAWS